MFNRVTFSRGVFLQRFEMKGKQRCGDLPWNVAAKLMKLIAGAEALL